MFDILLLIPDTGRFLSKADSHRQSAVSMALKAPMQRPDASDANDMKSQCERHKHRSAYENSRHLIRRHVGVDAEQNLNLPVDLLGKTQLKNL